MGLGLFLTGRCSGGPLTRKTAPEAWLRRAEAWVRGNYSDTLLSAGIGEDFEGKPALFVRLHPSAESVDIVHAGRGRVEISAKTSTTGSGYHLYVCELVRRLGNELGVAWDPPRESRGTGDETGYFHTGDRSALELAMLGWLQAIARITLSDRSNGAGMDAWCLPVGHRYACDSGICTPTGHRSPEWLATVADDPRRGVDFFAWWHEGQGAPYYLGRALCQMWTDVRWRPPLTEEETDLLVGITDLLACAYRMDSNLAYPWREWHELLGYLGSDSPLAAEVGCRAEQALEGPMIGYRRGSVTVELTGGWSIEAPGSLAERWDDGTWEAWDRARSIHFSSYSTGQGERLASAEETLSQVDLPTEGESLEYRGAGVLGRAVLQRGTEESAADGFLTGASAAAGSLALLTVCYQDSADRQWAIDTWHSLTH